MVAVHHMDMQGVSMKKDREYISFNYLLSNDEIELINGMIRSQLNHAARCNMMANQKMAAKQKEWDMRRVELLKKVLRVMGG